ncbi:DUF368 domain-containing protein [soil metagenome]
MPIPQPLAQVARGFAMGAADIVPGVSGGTVALVVGIYDRLIENVSTGAGALRSLVTGDVAGFTRHLRSVEWVWLLSLLAGIFVAVAALSSVLERLLSENPVEMGGLFFGLVVASAIVAFRLLARVDATAVALMVGSALALFLLLGLRTDTEAIGEEVATVPAWAFFLAGAVAICAMILPGISGSFILVMLGMYLEVLGAVNEREIVLLGVFLVGAVLGLAVFSTLLNWLLERYRDWVLAAMIGLMAGSLRVLWPWPGGVNSTTLALPAGPLLVPVLLAIVGFVVVLGIELGSKRLAGTSEETADPEVTHPL